MGVEVLESRMNRIELQDVMIRHASKAFLWALLACCDGLAGRAQQSGLVPVATSVWLKPLQPQ